MTNKTKSIGPFGILILCASLLFSCNKDAGNMEENRLVVTKTDRSIPTDYDIVEFNIVTEEICFAIGENEGNFKLFKTLNGGKTWQEMNNPAINFESNLIIQSIVFFDELNGAVVINSRAYRTYDGGQTWSSFIQILPPPGIAYAFEFIYAGKTEAGELLLVESNGNPWYENRMFTSFPENTDYMQIASFEHDGMQHDYGRYMNGKFIFLARDFNNWDYEAFVYDFATADMDTLEVFGNMYDIPNDAAIVNERIVFARASGKINFHNGNWESWNVDFYNFHDEDYHSIEVIDDYLVAVANRSISTNYSGKWEEAINPNGTGHQENFKKVQKIDNSNFYISGDNGLFIKATFQ